MQGELVNIECSPTNSNYDSYVEREFYFVDYSDGNKYKLMNISSGKKVEFSLTLLIISEEADFIIYIKCVNDSDFNQSVVMERALDIPLQIDFEITAISNTSFTVNVKASKDFDTGYYTYYAIGPIENGQFESVTDSYLSYTDKEFKIYADLQPSEFNLTIKVK